MREMNYMMMRNNYHTHTYRCGHAYGEDEDYVVEAIGAGMQTLVFSDHVMLEGFSQPNVRGDFALSEGYFSSIRNLKEKYKERTAVGLSRFDFSLLKYGTDRCGI